MHNFNTGSIFLGISKTWNRYLFFLRTKEKTHHKNDSQDMGKGKNAGELDKGNYLFRSM